MSVLEKYGCPLLILWFLLLAILIAVLTPFEGFPDEKSHYDYARYIRLHWQLPPLSFHTEEIVIKEAFQPPLYYLVTSLFVSPRAAAGSDYLNLRFLSIFFGALSLILLYRTTTVLFEQDSTLRLLVVAFVALNPQFIFVHSGITNISITTFTCALTLYWMIKVFPITKISSGIVMGIFVGLCLLSRIATIYLLPVAVFVILFSKPSKAMLFTQVSIFLLTALAVCGWWYIRNWMDYGDPLLVQVVKTTIGRDSLRKEPLDLTFWLHTFAGLHASFWVYFGRNEFHATIVEYAIYLTFVVVAIAGLFEMFFRGYQINMKPETKERMILIVVAFAFALAEFLVQRSSIGSPQGRYLYMAIVPIAVLMGTGLFHAAPFNRKAWTISLVLFLFVFCNYNLIRFWLPHVL